VKADRLRAAPTECEPNDAEPTPPLRSECLQSWPGVWCREMRSVCRDVSVFLVLWLMLSGAGRRGFLQDPGTFWHVATGERMLTTGSVLRTDPFGVASFGKPWIPMQWLAELGMAWLYRLGKLDALVAFSAVLQAVLYAALARHLLRSGVGAALALALVALALAMSSHHFIARPHLFTILFTALTQACLSSWEEGEARSQRHLFCLPVCILLWTNLHGGALGGVAMLSLTALGVLLGARFGLKQARARRRDLAKLLAVCGMSCLVTLVNPFFTALPRTWLTLTSSRVLPLLIKEHRAPHFDSLGEVLFALTGVLYLALLAGVPRRAWRVTWFLPLAWFVLGTRSVRHLPLFAITAMIVLPQLLAECGWFRRVASRSSLLALTRRATEREPYLGLWLPALLVLVSSLTLEASSVRLPVVGAGWAEPSRDVLPMDMLAALSRAARARPEGSGILNEMSQGGFLMLYEPRLRVFIDDRWEVHGDATFMRYVRASNRDPAELVAWARQLHIDLALAPHDSLLFTFLSQAADWTLLMRGENTSLFEFRSGAAALQQGAHD